jgi:putative zinc finger/helix-turn-helix YgiT family protein
MRVSICPACEHGNLDEVQYDSKVKFGRKLLGVYGLRKSVCNHCGDESVTEEQFSSNNHLVELAASNVPHAISAGLLQSLRQQYQLTQKDASTLFAAGANSFAKWESSQVAPSGPAALLLQCAFHVPGVMNYLASLHKVKLSPAPASPQRSANEPLSLLNFVESDFHTFSGATHVAASKRAQGRMMPQVRMASRDELHWQKQA